MISRIRGELASVVEGRAEVRSGDMFYEVLVPSYMSKDLFAKRGKEVEFHVHYFIEGGAGGATMVPRLIGFSNPAEREMFHQLVKVPGMGSRKVLKAMVVPPAELARAVEQKDAGALSGLPGVGKRTADKIIASLTGKLGEFAASRGEPSGEAAPAWGEVEEEAVLVLVQLAYKQSEAEALVRKARKKDPGLGDAQKIVQAVLREVGSEALR